MFYSDLTTSMKFAVVYSTANDIYYYKEEGIKRKFELFDTKSLYLPFILSKDAHSEKYIMEIK